VTAIRDLEDGVKPASAFWRRAAFIAVGLLLLGWLLNTPPGLMGKADAVGYAVCHRIDLRSFHLGERQLPLCARCTGMYLGAVAGLAYQQVLSRRRGGTPGREVIIALALLVLFFVVDGLNSFISFFPEAPVLYQPQNALRLLAGSGMGIAIAVALFPAFNQTAWVNWDSRAAMPGLRSLAGLALLVLLVDVLVLSENPLLLYPLALISAAGVLTLLTLAYSMVWLMILHAENRILRVQQLVLPFVGGFGLALAQIILLDLARYALTGTWEGFHLG
jgi:uncharacterized membrane protein